MFSWAGLSVCGHGRLFVERQTVESSRQDVFDGTVARTDAPGSLDGDVLALAVRENRILLTFDKDFGELAWGAGLPASCGIVLFRLPMPSPAKVGTVIVSILDGRDDWAGQFSVIEPGRVRMRSLPSKS